MVVGISGLSLIFNRVCIIPFFGSKYYTNNYQYVKNTNSSFKVLHEFIMVLDITLILKQKRILQSCYLVGPISIEKPIKRFTGPTIYTRPMLVLDITLIFKQNRILQSCYLEGPISIENPIKRFIGPTIYRRPIVPQITKAYYRSLTSTLSKIWILKDMIGWSVI